MKNIIKNNYTSRAAKSLLLYMITAFTAVAAFAQNVADSDLNNSADTNSNWYGQGWFWIIGAVVLAILVWAISRDRTKRRLDTQRNQRFKNVK